jgi:negative regulator of replication initiation
MKKIKLYLIGQKYEIEIEDEFYEYIKEDISSLNNSDAQVKDLLNIMLKFSYKSFKNEQKMKNLLKKLDL